MESEVDFIACDNEHATRFTIHILATVAESDARAISERRWTFASLMMSGERRGVSPPVLPGVD